MPVIRAAVGVIVNQKGDCLLSRRPADKSFAGYWEFPGGKIEPLESPEEALIRELQEELNIEVIRFWPWFQRSYEYPHATVHLIFFRVSAWRGNLKGHEGQELLWVHPSSSSDFPIPLLPTNTQVLQDLQLPTVIGITQAEEVGPGAQLEAIDRACFRGLRWIHVREKNTPFNLLASWVAQVQEAVRPWKGKVILNGTTLEAQSLGVDGVHWTSERLWQAVSRPQNLWVSASCHTEADLEQAERLGLDYVFLGPVLTTNSHKGSDLLGWSSFGKLVRESSLPIYAIGGQASNTLRASLKEGGQGWASRSNVWQESAPVIRWFAEN